MTSSYERSFITVTGCKLKIYHLSIAKKRCDNFIPGLQKKSYKLIQRENEAILIKHFTTARC